MKGIWGTNLAARFFERVCCFVFFFYKFFATHYRKETSARGLAASNRLKTETILQTVPTGTEAHSTRNPVAPPAPSPSVLGFPRPAAAVHHC